MSKKRKATNNKNTKNKATKLDNQQHTTLNKEAIKNILEYSNINLEPFLLIGVSKLWYETAKHLKLKLKIKYKIIEKHKSIFINSINHFSNTSSLTLQNDGETLDDSYYSVLVYLLQDINFSEFETDITLNDSILNNLSTKESILKLLNIPKISESIIRLRLEYVKLNQVFWDSLNLSNISTLWLKDCPVQIKIPDSGFSTNKLEKLYLISTYVGITDSLKITSPILSDIFLYGWGCENVIFHQSNLKHLTYAIEPKPNTLAFKHILETVSKSINSLHLVSDCNIHIMELVQKFCKNLEKLHLSVELEKVNSGLNFLPKMVNLKELTIDLGKCKATKVSKEQSLEELEVLKLLKVPYIRFLFYEQDAELLSKFIDNIPTNVEIVYLED